MLLFYKSILPHSPTCGMCAKYHGWVYSVSGKDKRFPALYETAFQNGYSIHPNCQHRVEMYYENEKDNGKIDKSIDTLERTENFKQGTKQNAIRHIFQGEVVRKGDKAMAVGYHFKGVPGSKGRIIKSLGEVDKHGVYRAIVEIDGVKKRSYSTFFPKSWSSQKVVDAINAAYESRVRKGNNFIGKLESGMDIEMVIRNNKITSAWPIYSD